MFTKRINRLPIVAKMALIYSLCGAAWIFFSDSLLLLALDSPEQANMLQTAKGWLFVALTAVLFYFALKKVHKQLSKTKKAYEQLFASSRDGLLIASPEGIVAHANDAFLKMFGLHLGDITGKDAFSFCELDWGSDSTARNVWAKVLSAGQSEINRAKLYLPGKQLQSLEVFAYKVSFKNRESVCISFRDITQYISLQNELNGARLKAEEGDRLKAAFLQNLSHEIRTPLNGIVGFSEMLSMPDISKTKQEQYIHTIVQCSHQLLEVVSDILDISKIETGQVKTTESSFRINELLSDLEANYSDIAKDKSLVFSVLPFTLGRNQQVIGDRHKIYQVCDKLLGNAFKFTTRGVVSLGVTVRNGDMVFCVADTGPGIAKKMQQGIFQRFSKGEVELKKDYGGTGLGLAICKGLAELLRGRIWVDSDLGEGARFFFSVPLKLVPQLTDAIDTSAGATALLIDLESVDDIFIRSVLALENISCSSSHIYTEAATPSSEKSSAVRAVFINIDSNPEDTATRAIEASRLYPRASIIGIDSSQNPESRIAALEQGCTQILPKPISKEDIERAFSKTTA
jgi:PAS domain S-box-containing protein